MIEDIWIETDETRVYGRCAGEPESPLILGIHGWSQRNGAHTWEPLLKPLAEAGYFAVSVDMPGWGRSKALHDDDITAEEAQAVVWGILEDLGHETAVLMGKSWGGRIAYQCAIDHPERVSHLVLSAPALQSREIESTQALKPAVLMTWAIDDEVIPISYGRAMQKALPVVEFVSYPTGGHSAAMNNADDFAPKIINFLTLLEPFVVYFCKGRMRLDDSHL